MILWLSFVAFLLLAILSMAAPARSEPAGRATSIVCLLGAATTLGMATPDCNGGVIALLIFAVIRIFD